MPSEASERFEALYAQLEEHARRLEQGNLPLEVSLKLYEEGAALVDRLRAILEGAELKLQTIQQRLERETAELQEIEEEYDEAEFDAGE
ncbi:MAG: exodeoxyribonuclease VII small subunit [Tepidiforma sp.]|nr:exodeoxyribonuclease VII small subunit [Tepidiforma sp.]GIW19076.1 MAG: hypothetical protein KatS3mg064_2233 [Tepidiforma sp.]